MADNFQLIIEAAIARAQSEKKIKSQVKEIQDHIGGLDLDVKVTDSNVKSAITKVNKLVQEGSSANIKARQEELRIQKMAFQEEQLLEKKKLTERQNTFKITKQSANEEIQLKKLVIQSQKLQIQEEKLKQSEITKTAKIQQDLINIQLSKSTLGFNIDDYIKNNPKLTKDLINQLTLIKQGVDEVDKVGLKNLEKQFRNVQAEARALGKTGDTVFSKLGKNVGQFLQFLSAGTLVMSGVNAVRNMVKEVKNLDSAMISLKKVTDETNSAYNKFLDSSADKARNLGRSISSLVEQTAEWAKLGYSLNEASKLAEISSIYANVGEVDDKTAVSDLVTGLKAMNMETSEAIRLVDMYNKLGNEFAVTSAGIGEGVKNSASALALQGNSIEQIVAMLTGGGEITQNVGELGNMLKVASLRIASMKGSLEELGETYDDILSVSSNQTKIYNLTKGQVNILDEQNKKLKDTYTILAEVAEAWDDVNKLDQSSLLELLFGKQRANQGAAILQAFQSGQVQAALDAANDSVGSALAEQQKYMEGIQYSADKMLASFQELSNNTVNSEWIKWFYELSNVLIQVIDNIGLFNIAFVAAMTLVGVKTGILPSIVYEIGNIMLAQTGWTASTYAQAFAQVGLTGAIKATTTAMISFLATNPVGWAILAAGAVFGAVKAYEHFNVTLEENQEALSNLKGEYDSVTNEVKSLEEQIASVQSKMKEMEKLNPVEFVNDNEYQKLSDSNDQLDRRLTIQKELQKIAGKEAEEKAIETIGQRSEKSLNPIYTTSTEGMTFKSDVYLSREDAINERITEYNKLSESIKELEERQLSLDLSTKKGLKEYSKLDKELTNLNNTRDKHYSYIVQTMQALDTESESIIGATKNGEQYVTSIDNLGNQVTDFIAKTKKATESINDMSNATSDANKELMTFDIATYAKQIDELQTSLSSLSSAQEKLAKGNLSSSEVLDLLQEFPQLIPYVDMASDGFGNLSKGLSDVSKIRTEGLANDLISIRDTLSDTDKLSLDTLVNTIKKMGKEAIVTSSKLSSISKAITDLDKLTASMNSLDSAYSKLKSKEKLDISDLTSLQEAFGNTKGFEDFISVAGNAKSITEDVQKEFNKLTSTYINSTGILDDLNDENKKLITSQLELLGISNANEIVTQKLAQQKQILAGTGIDVVNATADEIVALLDETDIADETRIALVDLTAQKLNVNNITLSTVGDIKNLLSLMSIANATSESLVALQAIKEGKVGAGRPGDYQNLLSKAQAEADAWYSGLGNNVNYSGGSKTQSASKKDKDKFSKVFDWIPVAAEKAKEKAINIINSIADSISYKSKNKKIELAISAKMDEKGSLEAIKKSYDNLAKGVKFSKDELKYRDLVDNGALKVETITDEKLANKIDEYTKWRDAAKNVGEEISKISDTIKELNQQKLDNIKSYFDMGNSYTNSKISKRESLISLRESNGGTATKGDYNYLIKLQKDIISNNKKEREAYETLFNDQVKDKIIKKGSQEYYEGLSYLNDLTISAREAQAAIQDLSNEKIKLTFVEFDKDMEQVNKELSELDLTSSLADKDSIEQIALFQTGYAIAAQKAKDLNTEISKLNKQYAKNKDDVVYKERLADLESQLSSNATAMHSYEQSIISAMKSRYDKELDLSDKALKAELKNIEKAKKARLDALKAELDKFKEIIDARKKALQDELDEDNYQDEVSEYNKSIAKLEDRIETLKQAEISGDLTARKERREAEDELAKHKKDLDKLQKKHSVDEAIDALDDEYDAYEKMKNKQISDAEAFYDLQTIQAQSVYDNKVAQLELLYENERQLIIEAAQLTSNEFSKAFDSINNTLAQYGISISSGLSSSFNNLGEGYANDTSRGTSVSKILGTKNESNKYQQDTTGMSELNEYLASQGYKMITTKQMVELAKALGLSDINSTSLVGKDEIGRINKNRIKEALMNARFAKTGMVKAKGANALMNSMGEDGIVAVRDEEIILSQTDSKTFKDFLPVMNNLMAQLKPTIPDISNLSYNKGNSPIVTINLPANTTISKDAIESYRKFIPEITNEVSNAILTKSNSR